MEYTISKKRPSERIKSLIIREDIPQERRGLSPFYGRREYRGKKQWVVGYNWHRMYAHHASGLVYESVLGWGETLDAAIEKAAARGAK